MSERMYYRQQPCRRPGAQPAALRGAACPLPEREEARFPVAMTYTPWQRWGEPYCAQKGLERGTIFPDLDLPFAGRRC